MANKCNKALKLLLDLLSVERVEKIDGEQVKSLIAKRVIPSELPAKASLEIWQDFLDSVKREVDFYNTKRKSYVFVNKILSVWILKLLLFAHLY